MITWKLNWQINRLLNKRLLQPCFLVNGSVATGCILSADEDCIIRSKAPEQASKRSAFRLSSIHQIIINISNCYKPLHQYKEITFVHISHSCLVRAIIISCTW